MPAGRRGARVAIVKPDFRVAGGFERVVDHVEAPLVAQGHELTRLTVDMIGLPRSVRGLDVPDDVYDAMPEYFRYVAGVEAFDALDTRRYDLVLSTQPPSVAHRHPRQPVETLVDPRLAASCAVLEADGGRLSVEAAKRHLASHEGGADGWTICMHVPEVEATTASLVARLPEDGPPEAWFSLGSPCEGRFVPVGIGPLPPGAFT